MCITPKSTLLENTNELQEQGYEVGDDNEPLPDNNTNPETQQEIPI